jgi:hypothetical protein
MKKIQGLLACALLASLPAMAQKDCSKSDAAAADKAVDKIVNAENLKKTWSDYGHCDAGNVSESFTDAILRLMVAWKEKDVERLAQDMQDPAYKKFIHKHLQSPEAKDDRQSIYSRAKASCPMTQGQFCAETMEVVKDTKGGSGDLLAPLPTLAPAPAAGTPKK